MATTHYAFPTINGSDTIDGVNAINGLANAVDSALYNVEQTSGSTPGANSVSTTAIQNGAVTNEKLSTSLQSQIQQGVSAATTAQSAQSTAQSAQSTANSVNNAWTQNPQSIGQSMNGNSAVYIWGNVVSVQLEAQNVPGNSKTLIGRISSTYAPTRKLTGACVSSATGQNHTGYLQVDTSGNIYVNMLTGSSTNEDPTGCLMYLTDRL